MFKNKKLPLRELLDYIYLFSINCRVYNLHRETVCVFTTNIRQNYSNVCLNESILRN